MYRRKESLWCRFAAAKKKAASAGSLWEAWKAAKGISIKHYKHIVSIEVIHEDFVARKGPHVYDHCIPLRFFGPEFHKKNTVLYTHERLAALASLLAALPAG